MPNIKSASGIKLLELSTHGNDFTNYFLTFIYRYHFLNILKT